jgi:hypothetical protein
LIEATFRHTDEVDGEPVGPIILTDPDDPKFREELETMPLSMAKKLAEMNRWPLAVEP